MLLQLIYILNMWDSHCLNCERCDEYNRAFQPTMRSTNGEGLLGPCAIGKAILLNMLRCLQQGL